MSEEKSEVGAVETRVYELGVHLLPTIAEENVAAAFAGVKELVESKGGVMIAEEAPRLLALAYTIYRRETGKAQPFSQAYFGWLKFDMEPERAAELKREAADRPEVLRSLVIETIRESTLSPKKIFMERSDQETMKKEITALRDKEKGGPVSEEELDKTIEGLVVQ